MSTAAELSDISQTKQANRQLRLLLLGLGRVGLKHIKAVVHNKERFRIVAIVDNNPRRAAELWQQSVAKTQMPPIFESVDALPAELDLDVAAICTPSGTHYDLAKKLMARNLHCFVEKPLTLDYKEALELKAIAEASNLKLALGYIYRFFPLVELIQNEVTVGKFGRVLSGSVGVYWGHDQAYYDLASWRGTWAQDGGVLMNQCVHALDLMTWLMNDTIVSAQATIARQKHRMEAEDFALVNYELKNGSFLQLTGTTNASPKRQRAEFSLICEKMELHCGIHKGKPFYKMFDQEGKKVSYSYLRKFLKQMLHQGFFKRLRELRNPHSGIYRDFYEAITENRQPLAAAAAGCDSLAAILCAYASASQDGRVTACPQADFKLSDMLDYFPKN